jgi:hypothetical protein
MAETENRVRVKTVKAYKVVLSTRTEIKIDEDEIANVIEGIKSGKVVRVRQGIFNPSYFVCIERDSDRIERFLDDTKHDTGKRLKGITLLKDILEDVKVRLLPEAPRRPELPASSSEQHG